MCVFKNFKHYLQVVSQVVKMIGL